jgi:hypothetical protein
MAGLFSKMTGLFSPKDMKKGMSKLGLGGGGGGTSTTINDLPAWARDYAERGMGRQEEAQLAGQDLYEGYKDTDYRPEGWSLEEEASMGMLSELPSQISGLEHAGMGFLEEGAGTLDEMGALTAGISQDDIDRFMNPYTENVISNTTQDMEEQSKRQQMEQEARSSAVGGMGGSRAAVADILRERQLGRETAAYGDKARGDAFKWATDTARGDRGEEFGRNQDLSEGLGKYSELSDKMASTKATRDMSMAEMMSGMGETKRTGQNTRDQFPMQLQDWYQKQVGGGVAAPSGVGETTSTQPGEGNSFSQLLGAGASIYAASDERIKTDVAEAPGLDLVRELEPKSYRYMGDADRSTGLMAQDIEKLIPSAVAEDPGSGVKMVNVYPIVGALVKAVKELDARPQVAAQGGL